MTTQALTVANLVDHYDYCAECQCLDGRYEIRGDRMTMAQMTCGLDDADSVVLAADNLAGWSDYDHHLRIVTRVGNINIMARLK